MGYPFFTWRPHQTAGASGDRETINLTEDLTDLQITPKRDVVDSFSIAGGRSRENLRAWMEVRIQLDRFTDRELFRQFRSMIDHLERGGNIAFGNDSAKCYATKAREDLYQGYGFIKNGINIHKSFHASAPDELAAGDEIAVESFPPKASREYHVVKSVEGSDLLRKINFGPTGAERHLQDDYSRDARVRHADFFPVLIMPTGAAGSAMLTHDRRITYSLDINLTYVLPIRVSVEQAEATDAGSSDPSTGGTDSPDYDAADEG